MEATAPFTICNDNGVRLAAGGSKRKPDQHGNIVVDFPRACGRFFTKKYKAADFAQGVRAQGSSFVATLGTVSKSFPNKVIEITYNFC